MIPWIMIAIAVLIIVLAAVFLKKQKTTVDYKQYYNIGLTWLPLGIVFMAIFENIATGAFFFIMGLVYISIGLKNKKKWGKKVKLSKQQIKMQKYLMIGLLFLVLLGFIAFEFFSLGMF